MPEREHRRSETAHRESAYRPKPPWTRVRSLDSADQRAGDEGLHLAAAVDGVGPLGVVEVVVVAVRASNHEGLDAGGEGGGKRVADRWVAQIARAAWLAVQQVEHRQLIWASDAWRIDADFAVVAGHRGRLYLKR